MRKSYVTGQDIGVDRLPNGQRKLTRPLHFKINGVRHTVPRGFETDYASDNWASRWLVRWSRIDQTSVLHDWNYKTGGVSRREADRLFRVVAQGGEHAANPVQAWAYWAGLRVGGWWQWNKYRRGAGWKFWG